MGVTPDRFPGPREEDEIQFGGDQLVKISRDDLGNMVFLDENNTLKTLTQLVGDLPDAEHVGQVLTSIDGSSFTVQTPLTSTEGWLTNDDGVLLVVG